MSVEFRESSAVSKDVSSRAEMPKYAVPVILGYVILMMIIPWEAILGYGFVDRNVYLEYFLFEKNILDYKEFNSLLDYVKNEALWHYLVPVLVDDWGISIEVVFGAISVFCLSVFGFFSVRYGKIFAPVFLISPLVVTLAFSQLRMALAYSLVVTAFMIGRKKLAVILILPAIFIHTSIIMFLMIYFALYFMGKFQKKYHVNKQIMLLASVFLGVAISVVIGPLRHEILGMIGDRRADYVSTSSSVLYTLFWVGLFFVAWFQRESFYKSIVNRYSITILALVTMNLVTGGYTLRFLAIGLPMIISSIFDFDKDKAKVVAVLYFVYLVFQWVYWAKIGMA